MQIAVTGAFGYSGRYIAKRLLDAGRDVMTLTNSVRRENPFGERLKAVPFHFDEPQRLRDSLGLRRPILSMPPTLGYWACRLTGLLVRDVVITREEIRGLMENRLYVDAPPLGTTTLTEWIERHRDTLGCRYTSEMARRTDRVSSYASN